MGNVLVPLAAAALPLLFYPRQSSNPTMGAIAARQHAERALSAAVESAQAARRLAEQIQQDAEQERQRARARQEEADRIASQAVEEMERMRAQMSQAAMAARHAEELAEAATRGATEDAMRFALEAEAERERAQALRDEAERAIDAVRGEVERAQQAADVQCRLAEAARAQAEQASRTAAEEVRRANSARQEAEERLRRGIQPVVTPSPQEVEATKRRIQYREDRFHFAIAGISGSGKSSLVNAFRGLRTRDAGAAAVGVTETTLQLTRYPDPNPAKPFVWYDIPGAGTFRCPDWQYFNNQGLYVFDCIVVLFDNRFTMTDIAVLTNARRFNVPTYIVRSKADQHIRNVMKEMGYDSEGDEDEDVDRRRRLYNAARTQFVDRTRRSVQDNLRDANLADQRVYIVSSTTLLSVVQNRAPRNAIDEVSLVSDLVNMAHARQNAEQ